MVTLYDPHSIPVFVLHISLDDILYGVFRSMQQLLDFTAQKISQDFTKAQKVAYNYMFALQIRSSWQV